MKIAAKSVDEYLAKAREDRQEALHRLRNLLRDHLPEGFSECLSYGIPGHVVPHSLYPPGYHCDHTLPLPFVSFANQKNSIALYHMGLYASPEDMAWFQGKWNLPSTANWTWGKAAFGSRILRKSLGPCWRNWPNASRLKRGLPVTNLPL